MNLDLLIATQADLQTFGRRFDAEVGELSKRIRTPRMPRQEFCDVLDNYLDLLKEADQVAERNKLRLTTMEASPESASEAIAILVRLTVAKRWLAETVKTIALAALNGTGYKPKPAEPKLAQPALAEPETYSANGKGKGGLRLPYRYAEEPDEKPDTGCCSMGTIDLSEKGKS